MKKSSLAWVVLAFLTPFATWASERPITIDEFLEPGGRVRVIAHRGFSGAAPENTLAAIRAAIEIGADMAEIDVTLSADGRVVVIHDDTVDRTTDGRGAVSGHTLAELQRLDAGAWYAPQFAGERLPTLDEVLAEVEGRILLNVEIKAEAVERGIVRTVAAIVRDRGMNDTVIVSSFSPAALEQMRDIAPEIRTGVLFNPEFHQGLDAADIVTGLGASAFNIKRARLTRAMSRQCRDAGIPVAVYTVNSPRRLRRLIKRGVHAVFTDHPDRMVAVRDEAQRGDHRESPRVMAIPQVSSGMETETGTVRLPSEAGVGH
jgi:glycerophosphoryl diester phosphodiesterase